MITRRFCESTSTVTRAIRVSGHHPGQEWFVLAAVPQAHGEDSL
jgi:hypothetical protein